MKRKSSKDIYHDILSLIMNRDKESENKRKIKIKKNLKNITKDLDDNLIFHDSLFTRSD